MIEMTTSISTIVKARLRRDMAASPYFSGFPQAGAGPDERQPLENSLDSLTLICQCRVGYPEKLANKDQLVRLAFHLT
jgi:hypothetical protein